MTQVYYGTKRVTAWPETQKRKVNDKLVSVDGYAVTYADGYRSWSPKEAFEAAYKPVTAMDCSGAIQAVKDGKAVKRADEEWSNLVWDSKGIHSEDSPEGSLDRVILTLADIFATDWLIVT